MDFCVVTVYSLFAELDKRVAEARRLDLFEQGVGICLDGERAELDAVILLRCGWCHRRRHFRSSQSRLHIGAEGVNKESVVNEIPV